MISDGGRFMVERCWGAEKTLDGARMKAESRIAELEAEIDQLTAHDATERQDDKSPNDTQTQTFVYGKECEKFKKALRISVNVGCGFEGDAEDAAELLTLITGLESRIAELEAVNERLTVHSDIERQDDKSPNDTQTQTFVYGKEREE